MKYIYDPLVDALGIELKTGKVSETKEITPLINVDLDKKGHVLSIEILDASKQVSSYNFKKSGKVLGEISFKSYKYSKNSLKEFIAK